MAYVSVIKASPFFVGLSYLNQNWDLVKKDKIKYDDFIEKFKAGILTI